jgi:hypothetical protein
MVSFPDSVRGFISFPKQFTLALGPFYLMKMGTGAFFLGARGPVREADLSPICLHCMQRHGFIIIIWKVSYKIKGGRRLYYIWENSLSDARKNTDYP